MDDIEKGAEVYRPGVRAVVGSGLFFVGMTVTAVLFAPLGILAWPLPYPLRFQVVSCFARFNLWTLKWLCGLTYEVSGSEHIPSKAGVVFCKHQSMWETLVLQKVLPPQAWVLKRELLRVPFFGWGLAVLEPIAIDRSAGRKAVEQVISQGTDRLNKGRWIVVFPEGTRVGVGEQKKFGVGGVLLAKKAGASILPIAHNAGCFWPRRGFIKRPGVIRMVIGEPIETQGVQMKIANQQAKDWIDAKTTELEQQAYREE
jgi:1-acyl-sn-glycerol-3-phosphate acyltransferase